MGQCNGITKTKTKTFPTNDGKCFHVVKKLLDVSRVLTVNISLGDAELKSVPDRAEILLAETQQISY